MTIIIYYPFFDMRMSKYPIVLEGNLSTTGEVLGRHLGLLLHRDHGRTLGRERNTRYTAVRTNTERDQLAHLQRTMLEDRRERVVVVVGQDTLEGSQRNV